MLFWLLWTMLRLAPVIVDTISTYVIEYRDHGLIQAVLLNTVLTQAKLVITRIRTHVLASPAPVEEALAIRNSYKDSFNMIAVAAAISAQIAITALSLSHLEEVHWTATAAFVASLIYGLFAVYFSCLLQLKLGSLHQGREVLSWLINQDAMLKREHVRPFKFGRRANEHNRDVTISAVASFSAVMMLVAPSQLLNWSLCSFLVGVGIYYGQVFSAGLGMLQGQNANLAVLLVYIVATIGAATEYFLPLLGKALERYESVIVKEESISIKQLMTRFKHNIKSRSPTNNEKSLELGTVTEVVDEEGNGKQPGGSTHAPDLSQYPTNSIETLTRVFQESVRLQEANLKAMQDLVKLMAEPRRLSALDQTMHDGPK